jgi:HlyD family type I secretion membrane fusion protein
MNASPSYASFIRSLPVDGESRGELRRLAAHALVPLAAIVALGLAWSAAAPLSGAIVAPAQLKVEHNRKTVQHQEGGIVREILVRDGQNVRAGDPLVVVADARTDATLGVVRDQWRSELARRARASAEAALEPRFSVPAEIGETSEHVTRERALFAARRRMLDEMVAALDVQIREARAQASALESQVEATQAGVALSTEELTIHDKLARQGFIQRTRLIALERTAADYRARVGEYRSELAAARQRIGELQSRIAQVRNQYQSQAADELKQASAAIRELEQKLRPSQDLAERQVVRAPVDGEVMSMRVHAVGAAVGPREPLLDIVPGHERIVVDARIRPQDIDYVRRDGSAEVRIAAYDMRNAPPLPAKVVFVSPDRVTGAQGDTWYVATLELDAQAVAGFGTLRLTAGMPAEVYVATAARTVVDYLAEPLHVFSRRAMREP